MKGFIERNAIELLAGLLAVVALCLSVVDKDLFYGVLSFLLFVLSCHIIITTEKENKENAKS